MVLSGVSSPHEKRSFFVTCLIPQYDDFKAPLRLSTIDSPTNMKTMERYIRKRDNLVEKGYYT